MTDKPIIVQYELNTEGLRCPEPIMQIRKIIWQMQPGDIVHVTADDPASVRDIPSYCRHMDHILLKTQISRAPFQFWIQKGKIGSYFAQ